MTAVTRRICSRNCTAASALCTPQSTLWTTAWPTTFSTAPAASTAEASQRKLHKLQWLRKRLRITNQVLDPMVGPAKMERTPVSLLERICKGCDQEAWRRFVQLYSPMIYDWGRHCGLQPADSADLTQDVFTTLFQKLPGLTYDRHKSFRAWLRTVTLNHWRDRQRRIATRALGGNEHALAEATVEDGISVLEENEYRQHLVARALQIMRADFQPATWQAFWQHVVLGKPVADVAAELNLTVVAVYSAKSRVLNRLRQELEGLLD